MVLSSVESQCKQSTFWNVQTKPIIQVAPVTWMLGWSDIIPERLNIPSIAYLLRLYSFVLSEISEKHLSLKNILKVALALLSETSI